MTSAWMMYALAIGALIAGAAICAEWVLKSANKPVRFVWVTAISLTVLFTVVAPLRVEQPKANASHAPIVLPSNITVTEVQPSVFESLAANGRVMLQTLVKPVQTVLSFAGDAPAFVNKSAGVLWFASSFIAFAMLIAVYSRSMRERLRWPRMRVLGRSVRVAPDVGPAVIGMAPPEIVIPRWVLERNPEEQRLVLEHESEHVRAHDPLLLLFACVAVALMPWHAALWFMWSRLRLAVELDCDRRVLKRGVLKPAYGELLVELSSQRPWNSLAMPAFSWGTSHLEKRLVAMTARPARFTVARRVVSGGVVAVALLAACQSELPTAAQIESMDATAAAAKVSKMADSVVYFVDGKQTSTVEAKMLVAADIGKIEVMKKKPVSEIRISTLKKGTAKVVADGKTANDSIKSAGGTYMMVSDSVRIRMSADGDTSVAGYAKIGTLRLGATSDEVSVTSNPRKASDASSAQVMLRKSTTPCVTPAKSDAAGGASDCEPLIIIDGVKVNRSSFDGLNPDRIESIEIIKGQAAISTYGQDAHNGVIMIKMRK